IVHRMKKFLRPGVVIAADLILNALRQRDRETMIAAIARTLARVPAEQILTAQVFLDCLEDRCPIYRSDVRRNRERCVKVADEKILAAGFLGEFTEALCRRTYRQMSVAHFEQRQVEHVKR